MALVVDNCYQLTLNGTIADTRPFANVFHVIPLGAGVPTVVEAAESLFDAYTGPLAANMSNSVEMQSVNYVDLSSTTGDSGLWVAPAPGSGDAVSNAVPPAVCVLTTWAATGGRAFRNGRSYFPGADEGSVDAAGQLNGPTVTAWQGNVDDFLTALQNDDLALVVVSKTSATTGVARTVLSGSVQSSMATQRRRQRS